MGVPLSKEKTKNKKAQSEISNAENYAFEMLVFGVSIELIDRTICKIDLDKKSKDQLIKWRQLSERAYREGCWDYALALAQALMCTVIYAREGLIAFPIARVAEERKRAQREILNKKARPARQPKHDWEKVERLEKLLLAAGKGQREFAGIIESKLGVPRSTYRDWKNKKTSGIVIRPSF